MTTPPPSGDVSAENDIHARDIITGIKQTFHLIFTQPFQPAPDLVALRQTYLSYLRDCYRYLDMKGIMQLQQVTHQLSLAAVYVPLKAQAQQRGWEKRVAGRRLTPAEGATLPAIPVDLADMPPQQLIEEALQYQPAVVVLGDPGAGKSTLLKILALALATDETGPLPILIPLNAYARQLQKQVVSLNDFLGMYYTSRQGQLQGVGSLFAATIQVGQAVILLDGLDEVQAIRAHLVRLVQDFVSEITPQPRQTGDLTPLPGNRVVVTSRIVGYQQAPLVGEGWRVYTLTDFERPDIEQFVTQWTLAFTRTMQGDTPVAAQMAHREKESLLTDIFSRPSVEKLASNPLLLTILSLIKYTGVILPEQRVKLYKLYLETLLESWNRARSLDQYPVGPDMSYEQTAQILAPLAFWLRQQNPTAGLITKEALLGWLKDYYRTEWGYPPGQAYQAGQTFLNGVEKYTNLLLQRGEGQYGFLHLTLEEMLAAQGLVQRWDEDQAETLTFIRQHLADATWHEPFLLAVGFIGVIQQRPTIAGQLLQRLLAESTAPSTALFCGQALLDVGRGSFKPPVVREVQGALVQTMQSAANPIRHRRDAGDLLGRLGWQPNPAPDDLIPHLKEHPPLSLDALRPIPGHAGWLGVYPVTNQQFARFIASQGYETEDYWSETGWEWRTGTYDLQAPKEIKDWLKHRPPEKRNQPYYWTNRTWNNPLGPVVGVSWFEAEAYAIWLTSQLQAWGASRGESVQARLPQRVEWEAAMGGRGDYPWGDEEAITHFNCAASWVGHPFKNKDDWGKWVGSEAESYRQATTTAVPTFPQGVSQAGFWDGSGNVWEWTADWDDDGWVFVKGGSWYYGFGPGRVSARFHTQPVNFLNSYGFRVLVSPV